MMGHSKMKMRNRLHPPTLSEGFFIAYADSQRKFTLRLDIYTNYYIMRIKKEA